MVYGFRLVLCCDWGCGWRRKKAQQRVGLGIYTGKFMEAQILELQSTSTSLVDNKGCWSSRFKGSDAAEVSRRDTCQLAICCNSWAALSLEMALQSSRKLIFVRNSMILLMF